MGIEILDERNSVGFAPFDWVSDATDSVKDAVDDVWDALDDIPGFKQLGEGTKALFKGPLRDFVDGPLYDLVSGPLKDFANTDLGQTVLRAVAGAAGMASYAIPVIGPLAGSYMQMAAHALPGLAKGDDFWKSVVAENWWRITETAKILSAGQVKIPGLDLDVLNKLPEQFGDAAKELERRIRAKFPGVDLPGAVERLASQIDLEGYARDLARELGYREDMVVQAMEVLSRRKLLTHEDYDLATGKKTVSSFGRFTPLSPAAAALRGASLVSKAVQNPTLTQAAAKSPTAQALKGATLMSKVAPSRTVTILSSVAKKTPPIMMSVVKPLASVTPQGRPESVSTLRQAVTVEQEPSFWEEHKTKLLVGGGAVAIVGLYFWWSKR